MEIGEAYIRYLLCSFERGTNLQRRPDRVALQVHASERKDSNPLLSPISYRPKRITNIKCEQEPSGYVQCLSGFIFSGISLLLYVCSASRLICMLVRPDHI